MASSFGKRNLFAFLQIVIFIILVTVEIGEANGRLDKKKQSSLIDKTKTRRLLDKKRTFVGGDPHYYYLEGLYTKQKVLGKSKRFKRSLSRYPSRYYYQSSSETGPNNNNEASLSKTAEELNTLLLLLDGYAAAANKNNGKVNPFDVPDEDEEGLIKRMRNTNWGGHHTGEIRRKNSHQTQYPLENYYYSRHNQPQFQRGQIEEGPLENSNEKLEFLKGPSKPHPLIMKRRGKRIDTIPKPEVQHGSNNALIIDPEVKSKLEATVFKGNAGVKAKKDIDWTNYFGYDKKSHVVKKEQTTVPTVTTTQVHRTGGIARPKGLQKTDEGKVTIKGHEDTNSVKDDKPDRKWILNEFYKNLAMASSFKKRKRSATFHSIPLSRSRAQREETNELMLDAGDDLIDSALKLTGAHNGESMTPSEKHNLKQKIANKLVTAYDIELTRQKLLKH